MDYRNMFTMGRMGDKLAASSFSTLFSVLAKVPSSADMFVIHHHPEIMIGIAKAGNAMHGHLHSQPDRPGQGAVHGCHAVVDNAANPATCITGYKPYLIFIVTKQPT